MMSVPLFYTCGSAFSHIFTLMHFGGLQHHSDIFSTFLCSQTPKFPAHMSTISEYLVTCSHITHQYISVKCSTSSTHVLQNITRTFTHLQTHIPSYPIIFQVHYIASLNIFLHESTHMPNIQYYPHTACRIFALPSETFGHQSIQFLSIPDTFICIPKYFYCARTYFHASYGLHSSPSIQHLLPIH